MSRYGREPIDFTGLKTIGLAERGGKVKVADFARAYQAGSGIAGLMDSLPHILAGDGFRAVVDALASARERGRAILWGMGGHVIKCGLAPVLLDLMQRGYATAFRDERVGGDSRFRNRTGGADQRGRGGGAAGRAVRIGGGDGSRDESRDCGGRARRDRDGRGAGARAGSTATAVCCTVRINTVRR